MVNELFEKVTPIQYELGEEKLFATGFFYEGNNDQYLITNNHVVEHEYGVSPGELRINVRSEENSENVRPKYIDLFDDGEKMWQSHPEYNSSDVVAIPLNFDLGETGSSAFTEEWLMTYDENMQIQQQNDRIDLIGGDAIVVGYPLAFKEQRTGSPIVRNAVTASEYGPFFNGDPCFITDSIMHKGMSGSPVLTSPGDPYWSSDEQELVHWSPEENYSMGVSLLGVHSGPIMDPGRNIDDHTRQADLQLNQVWYAELIRDIVSD